MDQKDTETDAQADSKAQKSTLELPKPNDQRSKMVSHSIQTPPQLLDSASPRTAAGSSADQVHNFPKHNQTAQPITSTVIQTAQPITSAVIQTAAPIISGVEPEYRKYLSHMPAELQEDNIDILIIHAENNKADAASFQKHLMRDISFYADADRKQLCRPRVKLLDDIHDGSNDHLDLAFSKSLYVFLFVTKEFCAEPWTLLQGQACLTEAIGDRSKSWCVVPVHTSPKKSMDYKLPMMLNCLRPINYWLSGPDQFYKESVQKLLHSKAGVVLQRERDLHEERQSYFDKHKATILENIKHADKLTFSTGKLQSLENNNYEGSTVSKNLCSHDREDHAALGVIKKHNMKVIAEVVATERMSLLENKLSEVSIVAGKKSASQSSLNVCIRDQGPLGRQHASEPQLVGLQDSSVTFDGPHEDRLLEGDKMHATAGQQTQSRSVDQADHQNMPFYPMYPEATGRYMRLPSNNSMQTNVAGVMWNTLARNPPQYPPPYTMHSNQHAQTLPSQAQFVYPDNMTGLYAYANPRFPNSIFNSQPSQLSDGGSFQSTKVNPSDSLIPSTPPCPASGRLVSSHLATCSSYPDQGQPLFYLSSNASAPSAHTQTRDPIADQHVPPLLPNPSIPFFTQQPAFYASRTASVSRMMQPSLFGFSGELYLSGEQTSLPFSGQQQAATSRVDQPMMTTAQPSIPVVTSSSVPPAFKRHDQGETTSHATGHCSAGLSGGEPGSVIQHVHHHHHHHKKEITIQQASNVLIGDRSRFFNRSQHPGETSDSEEDSGGQTSSRQNNAGETGPRSTVPQNNYLDNEELEEREENFFGNFEEESWLMFDKLETRRVATEVSEPAAFCQVEDTQQTDLKKCIG